MASYDEYGQLQIEDTDPVNIAVDLTKTANAAQYGIIRVGTQTERLATPSERLFDGLEYRQIDGLPGVYRYHNGEWIYEKHFLPEVARFKSTSGVLNLKGSSGWMFGLPIGWARDDGSRLINAGFGNRISVAREGLYRLSASFKAGSPNEPVGGSFQLGWAVGESGSATNELRGLVQSNVTTDSVTRAQAMSVTDPIPLQAGDLVGVVMRYNRTFRIDGNHRPFITAVIERLGSAYGHSMGA